MRTLSNHKSWLGQWFKKIKNALTAERSIDWASFRHKVLGYVSSISTNQDLHRSQRWGSFLNQLKPVWFAKAIKNILVFCIVLTLAYTYLAVQRLPSFSDVDQPVQIYQIQDIQQAANLFGHQDMDLSKIQLTGLMRHDASSNGFAIFEIDGKNTGAIAVGETFDKGYFLKSLGADSVEVVFQGKQRSIVMTTKRF
jgi:hypothetical protein